MIKKVSFECAEPNESFVFRFSDQNGTKYYLDETRQPVKGMSPFIYDQIDTLKNVDVEYIKEGGKNYIIELKYLKKG